MGFLVSPFSWSVMTVFVISVKMMNCLPVWSFFSAHISFTSTDSTDVLLQRHDQQAFWPGGARAAGGQTKTAGGADSRGRGECQGEDSWARVSDRHYLTTIHWKKCWFGWLVSSLMGHKMSCACFAAACVSVVYHCREHVERAWVDMQRFREQKDKDLQEALISYAVMQISMCKKVHVIHLKLTGRTAPW